MTVNTFTMTTGQEKEAMVSVILCFHNEKVLLREAIGSVIAQDYGAWELLLVDDGSDEDSTRIAQEYVRIGPQPIRYLEHPYHQQHGLSASRNLGVKNARGAFVAFIDADDVWMPDKLSKQIALFRAHPEISAVVEASLYWWSWFNDKRDDVVVPVGVPDGVYSPPHLMQALYPLGTGAAPCPSGIMVRRSVVRRLVFEEAFRGAFQAYEDQAFLAKLYLGERVYVSGDCHNKYRQRPDSLVSTLHRSGNYDNIRNYFLYWLRDYLRSVPVRQPRIERLLWRAQLPYRWPTLYRLFADAPRIASRHVLRIFARLGLLPYSRSW